MGRGLLSGPWVRELIESSRAYDWFRTPESGLWIAERVDFHLKAKFSDRVLCREGLVQLPEAKKGRQGSAFWTSHGRIPQASARLAAAQKPAAPSKQATGAGGWERWVRVAFVLVSG